VFCKLLQGIRSHNLSSRSNLHRSHTSIFEPRLNIRSKLANYTTTICTPNHSSSHPSPPLPSKYLYKVKVKLYVHLDDKSFRVEYPMRGQRGQFEERCQGWCLRRRNREQCSRGQPWWHHECQQQRPLRQQQ
jgi:hypothetical protein